MGEDPQFSFENVRRSIKEYLQSNDIHIWEEPYTSDVSPHVVVVA